MSVRKKDRTFERPNFLTNRGACLPLQFVNYAYLLVFYMGYREVTVQRFNSAFRSLIRAKYFNTHCKSKCVILGAEALLTHFLLFSFNTTEHVN